MVQTLCAMLRHNFYAITNKMNMKFIQIMLILLKSLVIPLLEDCCQLWNPWKAKAVQAIEAI